MLIDLFLVIVLVGLVVLVAWALKKRNAALAREAKAAERQYAPMVVKDNIIVMETVQEPLVLDPVVAAEAFAASVVEAPVAEAVAAPVKKVGGRPKKVVPAASAVVAPVEPPAVVAPIKNKGGRPKKVVPVAPVVPPQA